MTEDPITKRERQLFLREFEQFFNDLYSRALTLDLKEIRPGSYTLAKCVLTIAAKSYTPSTASGIRLLRSLQQKL